MQGEFLVSNVGNQVVGGVSSIWANLMGSVGPLLNTFISGFLVLVKALLIFLIGRFIARLIKKGVEKLLEVAKFNTAADKLQVSDMLRKGNIDATPSSLVAKMIYFLIMIFVLIATFDALGLKIISQKFAELIDYIPGLIVAAIIFTGGIWLAGFVRDFVKASSDSLGASTGSIVSTGIYYVIIVIATIMALDQAGIETGFITSNLNIILGALLLGFAIAYGYASRGITEDLLAGLFNKSKVEKGQRIRVNDVEGEIISTDNVSVTVRTANETVIVPNKELSKSNVHLLG